jgi:antitoxin VapB
MGLNIKNEKALEEKLSRLLRNRNAEETLARLRSVLKDLPPPPPGATSDHSDLYDGDGLPV